MFTLLKASDGYYCSAGHITVSTFIKMSIYDLAIEFALGRNLRFVSKSNF